MKNKKVDRALSALEAIFDLKKDIGKTLKKAKDEVSTYGVQGIFLVKEFSDSIDELFKADASEVKDD